MNNPYLLLFLAPLIWAGNAIMGKMAVGEIPPYTLTFGRWVIAIIIIFPFAYQYLKKDWALIKKHFILLGCLGCIGFTAFNNLLYAALHHTSVINAAIEQAFIPLLILLINFLILKQSIHRLQFIGMIIAFLGVLLTITQVNLSNILHLDINKGDMFVIVAAVCYAIYTFGLRWKPDIHWLSFIFVLALSATISALPFFIWEFNHQGYKININPKSISILLFIATFPSIIAQLCYAKGVTLIGANRAGFAINLIPILGALMAVVLLSETFRWFHLVGLVFVLSGIALSEKSKSYQ